MGLGEVVVVGIKGGMDLRGFLGVREGGMVRSIFRVGMGLGIGDILRENFFFVLRLKML